ncbi:hypothetical protein ONA92_18325 [Mycobacteroides salmoniphilum]|uniref:hypothetical protein n=1 Tax=Mycobacteroides salmoniphilum TaxID=404941 RepID=UPI0035664B09
MSDASEWSERERDAAIKVFTAYAHEWQRQGRLARIDCEVRDCMDAMLHAVSCVRSEPAEPVDTVKLNTSTGDVARCMSHNGVRFWAPLILMPPPAPGQVESVNADDWLTIHDPSKVCIRVVVGPKPVIPIRIARQVVNLDASCRGSDWVDAQGDLWRWDRHATHGRWLRRVGDGPWCITPNTAASMYGPFREVI